MTEESQKKTPDDNQTKVQVEQIVKSLENITVDTTNVFSVIAAQTTILSLSAYAMSLAHLLPAGAKDQLLSKITQATKSAYEAVEKAQKEVEQKQQEIRQKQEMQENQATYDAPYGIKIDLNDETAIFPDFDNENTELKEAIASIQNAWTSSTPITTKTSVLNAVVFNDTPIDTSTYLAQETRINTTHAALTDTDGAYTVNHVAIDALRDIATNIQVMQQCDAIIENCTGLAKNPEKCAELGVRLEDVQNIIKESKNTKTVAQTATNKEVTQTELKSLADLAPNLADSSGVDMASVGLSILMKLRERKKAENIAPAAEKETLKEVIEALDTPETLEYIAPPSNNVVPITTPVAEKIVAKEESVEMPYGLILSNDVAMLGKVLSPNSNPFDLLRNAQQPIAPDIPAFIPSKIHNASMASPISPGDTPGNEDGLQGILAKKQVEASNTAPDAPDIQPPLAQQKESWKDKAKHDPSHGDEITH